ncbi:MAG TPA: response regulator [Planctomycetota bacterium]|nr:response regulator [Planctomycetota bacterium]
MTKRTVAEAPPAAPAEGSAPRDEIDATAALAPVRLLLVDDKPENLVVLESILDQPEFVLTKAQSAQDALMALLNAEYALLILDVMMPGMSGIELAHAVKARKKTRDVAIIFLTAQLGEDQHVLSGYEAGAVDYVTKPINPQILRSKVSVFVELYRKNVALRNTVEALNREIVERKRLEERLRSANDELEEAVRRRTSELQEVNVSLKAEMAERKQAAKELEKLATFTRYSPNLVLELAPDGALTYFNDSASAMASALGFRRVEEMLPADAAAIVARCLETGQPRLRLDADYDGRTLTWSFIPISALRAVHVYGVEITERLAMEAQLRQAQKMESVGQLAAGVAHDFNNILAVIQGYASLLSSDGGVPPSTSHGLKEITAAADRGANLTRQLLTFSRRQVIQPRHLDLNDVIGHMARMLERVLGDDVALEFSFRVNVPPVYADLGMMEQILLNLAVNSRDAMPRGGVIRIATGVEEVTHADAETDGRKRPGAYVFVQVADTGCGIPAEHLSRIFEPFFTTKDVGKGTGLGLATVYGIVQQHQGWIDVESQPGAGAVFKIHLPASESGAVGPAASPPQPEVRGGTESILVVEDEPALRQLVKRILEGSGYRVELAESGVAALDAWDRAEGRFDLLMTDMVMPGGVGGRELAEQLVARRPELKVIYCSGYSVEVAGEHLAVREDFNYLQKPYQPRKLLKVVRECLDR